ncbi:MAG: NAD(P)-binding protein [Planctomycetota bacterium]
MTQSGDRTFDAIVVGGNLCGIVSAWLLGELGFRVALVEKGKRLGGANSSFSTADGSTFDMGMHVLDYMRSEVTTRLFLKAIDGKAHKVLLRRAMVLRGHVIPYNAPPAQFPDELRKLLPGDDLVDTIGAELPTRKRLREAYGAYADFIYDEVLPAYPCELRHKTLGVDESRLLTNIYPWFFPRARRERIVDGESRPFHDRLRSGEDQYILYPHEHGFAGFARAFLAKMADSVEVICDIPDLDFVVEPGTHRVTHAVANGGRLLARRWFWCARWPQLLGLLGLPTQNLAHDNLLLGSFRFNEPALGDYNELIVGDPALHLDRVNYPGKFNCSGAPQLQCEYAFPVADGERLGLPLEADFWRERWLDNLRRIGLIDDRHTVESFDFRNFRMNFNSFGAEGEPRVEADAGLIRDDGNIVAVAPTTQNRNLNGSVPLWLESITQALARVP